MVAHSDDKSSASTTLSRQGRAALRIAGRKTGENRWARAFYRGGSAFVGSIGHVAHALWLEVTGFLFLVLAMIGGGATVREYRYFAVGKTTLGRVALAAAFALLFLYFGVESFLRARRRGKRR
jgi:hypothetical protein